MYFVMSFGCMLKIEEKEMPSCPHLTVVLMPCPLIPWARFEHFYTSSILYLSATP